MFDKNDKINLKKKHESCFSIDRDSLRISDYILMSRQRGSTSSTFLSRPSRALDKLHLGDERKGRAFAK